MTSGSEKKKDDIRKQAKLILNKFAKALAEVEEIPDSYVEREEDRRSEEGGEAPDSEFRKIFFENAPATKKDCIEAEKGKWK